jgi:peptidoglycan glycosyltransferase
VSVADAAGRPVPTIRRDYRPLLPLLRHRHQPNHRAVKGFLDATRDITLTIDAPLQARVARILEKYASRTSTGRAAAVVLDPDTGDVLASVSYPLPGTAATDEGEGEEAACTGSLRSGAIWPLRAGIDVQTRDGGGRAASRPGELEPDVHVRPAGSGRVGARVPGYGVVRDDEQDEHPHGSIAMRDAIVQSCNAYFAQLAVRLGPRPLLDTAALVGISVARDNSVDRLRETLPHAAYGQADVVATPLRMARVAAAIADGGVLRDPRLEKAVASERTRKEQRLLSPDAARLLASSLREAVTTGTGRSLAAHPWRIAGKTGTAENHNAPSHAWFVGFAPYDHADRKIAFAVLVENAGYGGAIAAPAAGEIVTAAATRGLVR